ncbi:MAG: retroviral-like aspartic protease family protein [Bacteroidales bacterium]|nr:retroviral-like aspartic protease family protein [Bacteroidales bacterium]
MRSYTKTFDCIVDVINTNAVVLPAVDLAPELKIPPHFYTENAVWDTGANTTVISSKIVNKLNLQPVGKGLIYGVGGDLDSNTYIIHLGLPNEELVKDLLVTAMDLPDYDILIGMDIINELDFAITNGNGKTKFTFSRPSTRDIDFQKD